MTYLNKCDIKEIKMYIKDKYGINSNGMLEFNYNKKSLKKLKKLRSDRGKKVNNDFVISLENRIKVLNYFLNNLALKVADDYLELL